MDQSVRQLASDSGPCLGAHGIHVPAGYQELALVFGNGTLRVLCDLDSDEVIVSAEGGNDLPQLDDAAISGLVGKVIEQAWTMTSDRGFDDGFQLRCIDLATHAEACIQFEAAGGVLLVAAVEPLRRHF